EVNCRDFDLIIAEFDGTERLLDENRGYVYLDQLTVMPGGTFITHSLTEFHIEATGAWNLKIGQNAESYVGAPYSVVVFIGSETAIMLRRTSLVMKNTEITGTRKFAVNADAQYDGNRKFLIESCYIHDTEPIYVEILSVNQSETVQSRGVRVVHGYDSIQVYSSYFENILAFGVDCSKNNGGK